METKHHFGSHKALAAGIKALTFDVFGTVVNWSVSVKAELTARAEAKVQAGSSSGTGVSEDKLAALSKQNWEEFALEWAYSYGEFAHSFHSPDGAPSRPWTDVDTHFHESLQQLLKARDLDGIYTDQEVKDLSRVWHRLQPWSDSSSSIKALGVTYNTATLSNGNRDLLSDLNVFGELGFRTIISAEDFRTYKPDPAMYLGAAKMLGVAPREVAHVAAHLYDLREARKHGFRTIYVERPGEEAWDRESPEYQEARGWVDLWIEETQDGFAEIIKCFGVGPSEGAPSQ